MNSQLSKEDFINSLYKHNCSSMAVSSLRHLIDYTSECLTSGQLDWYNKIISYADKKRQISDTQMNILIDIGYRAYLIHNGFVPGKPKFTVLK